MLELGIANFMMFFLILVIGLIFVVVWIVKSEKRIEQAREEIAKLGAEIEVYKRERFSLEEKMAALENAKPGAATQEQLKRDEPLEEENRRLKKELDEAKTSLEEVYKALSSEA